MTIEHYVEKSGYWIYNKKTKTFLHQSDFSYYNVTADDWIYVDVPGKIVVKDDKIQTFIPEGSGFDNIEQNELRCWTHRPKEYIGFTDKYYYCSVCGTKL